jgi:ubiquinone/menaquinone biosynthesis C-methylase UbiE
MKSAKQLKEHYKNGQNISQLMREERKIDYNSDEIIEMSYELQSGSYSRAMAKDSYKDHKNKYSKELTDTISYLCNPKSILEVGIGEATTFSGVIKNLPKIINCFGFDLSWSRVAYAKKWLDSLNIKNHKLCTGNLLDIPFLENSIDVVYTSHSIEPNGGKEEEILKELYRVTNKYLILLEPGYELTNEENQKRMDKNKYCKNLEKISKLLGFKVLKHELFKHSINSMNPTAITIIEKNSDKQEAISNPFACPKYKTVLVKYDDCYYSDEALSVYPIVNGIPCLRVENSILASKFSEVI